MNHLPLLIPLVFLLCLPFACRKGEEAAEAPGADAEADVAAIKASLDEWVQTYHAGDFERLMSVFYAENAILLPPDASVRRGKEAIQLGYRNNSELNDEHVDSSVVEGVRVS